MVKGLVSLLIEHLHDDQLAIYYHDDVKSLDDLKS